MIKHNGTKITGNEYAKLFLARNMKVLLDNVDSIMEKTPELYEKFTVSEKNAFKTQLAKKVESIHRTLGIGKLTIVR
jgi:hypothetical protein